LKKSAAEGASASGLEQLKKLIEGLLGPKAVQAFEMLLEAKGEVTEEEVAEKLGGNKNATRKILYKLHELKLVSYKRVRNKDTGWYSYYWSASLGDVSLALLELKKAVLQKLEQKLASLPAEEGAYKCPKCGRSYSFGEALDSEFKCPRCEEELAYYDVAKAREVLEEYIGKLKRELEVERSAVLQSS